MHISSFHPFVHHMPHQGTPHAYAFACSLQSPAMHIVVHLCKDRTAPGRFGSDAACRRRRARRWDMHRRVDHGVLPAMPPPPPPLLRSCAPALINAKPKIQPKQSSHDPAVRCQPACKRVPLCQEACRTGRSVGEARRGMHSLHVAEECSEEGGQKRLSLAARPVGGGGI